MGRHDQDRAHAGRERCLPDRYRREAGLVCRCRPNGQRDISAKLTANINLNGKTWTAIGTSSNKFAGTLDGDNYTVSGLVTTGLVGELAEGGVVEICV